MTPPPATVPAIKTNYSVIQADLDRVTAASARLAGLLSATSQNTAAIQTAAADLDTALAGLLTSLGNIPRAAPCGPLAPARPPMKYVGC